MKGAAKQAMLQKASGEMIQRIASGSAGNLDLTQAIATVCDAVVKYLCKGELTEIETQRIWAQALPQFKEQFSLFINLMGQVVKAADDYTKLTVTQTNKIIDIIISQPDAPFEAKMEQIRKFMAMQNEHHEKILDSTLKAGSAVVGAAVTAKVAPVAIKKGAEVLKHFGTTSAVKAFSPSKVITATCKGAVKIIKAVKK